MPENTCLFKIRPKKYFYWMPIGFLHLVGLPKQFQSRSNPIFDSTVLEFVARKTNLVIQMSSYIEDRTG